MEVLHAPLVVAAVVVVVVVAAAGHQEDAPRRVSLRLSLPLLQRMCRSRQRLLQRCGCVAVQQQQQSLCQVSETGMVGQQAARCIMPTQAGPHLVLVTHPPPYTATASWQQQQQQALLQVPLLT